MRRSLLLLFPLLLACSLNLAGLRRTPDQPPVQAPAATATGEVALIPSPTVVNVEEVGVSGTDPTRAPIPTPVVSPQPAALPPPGLFLAARSNAPANILNPAYLEYEIVGLELERVWLETTATAADGQATLISFQELDQSGDGWQTGLNEAFVVWEAYGAYVSDGISGDFALTFPVTNQPAQLAVVGQYIPANGEAPQGAQAIFDAGNGQFLRMAGPDPAQTIAPVDGDQFQLARHLKSASDKEMPIDLGATLVFTGGSQLQLVHQPLPDGVYTLTLRASSGGDQAASLVQDITVIDNILETDLRAYRDGLAGFQFHYPAAWTAPAYEAGRLVSQGISDTIFSLSHYPQREDLSAESLRGVALERFGEVDVLYIDALAVAEQPALRTAYGYTGTDGLARTGVLVSFVTDAGGFLLDLDGPAARENETLATISRLMQSWQFLPDAFGRATGAWMRQEIGLLTTIRPTAYTFRQMDNGWHVSTAPDGETFLALRSDPLSSDGIDAALTRWMGVAGRDVTAFKADNPIAVQLSGRTWRRADFTYQDEAGEIVAGFVMVTLDGETVWVAWAEAPGEAFEVAQQEVFLFMVGALKHP
jgi:hypothetical protein